MLLSSLSDLILEPRHLFHLDVAFGSSAQLVHATRGFLQDCLQTYQDLEWGAWSVMLPLGWDYEFGHQCGQTCPWISREIHHFLVASWPMWHMSYIVIDWLHITHWNAQQECRSCRWTLEEIHCTRLMPPLWGTLGRHDTRLHRHWCTNLPGWGKHLDVHLDRWSHYTALGWVISNLRVCQLPWFNRRKGAKE